MKFYLVMGICWISEEF